MPTDNDYERVVAYFDAFAAGEHRWQRRTRAYHALIETIMRFYVPRRMRVLEVGSGSGDLLASLEPSVGVGVDASPAMVAKARERHRHLRFEHAIGEKLALDETFDYIVLSDLVPYVHDILALLQRVAAHSHARTRVVVTSYSRAWRPLIQIAELLRLKPSRPIRNWVSPHDVRNLLELSGFEAVAASKRILLPLRVPFLSTFVNGVLGSLPVLRSLSLTYWIVARPVDRPLPDQTVTVVCPCRNERGHVADVFARLPRVGSDTELIFVEGGSTDGTREEIERQIADDPGQRARLVDQPGTGKGDAVRAAFREARGDVLTILDGDLSVRPEDLPKFYEALVSGRGELINGSRLVYDVEPGAMRFLNMVGNRIFSLMLRGITGQEVKDTLCGTKALLRTDYERIAAERSYFGEFDPFGDFDLLLGASRLGLKITDMPVRYQSRTYGTTNIARWRHGWLLARMTAFAFWKFRIEPVRLAGRR